MFERDAQPPETRPCIHYLEVVRLDVAGEVGHVEHAGRGGAAALGRLVSRARAHTHTSKKRGRKGRRQTQTTAEADVAETRGRSQSLPLRGRSQSMPQPFTRSGLVCRSKRNLIGMPIFARDGQVCTLDKRGSRASLGQIANWDTSEGWGRVRSSKAGDLHCCASGKRLPLLSVTQNICRSPK